MYGAWFHHDKMITLAILRHGRSSGGENKSDEQEGAEWANELPAGI